MTDNLWRAWNYIRTFFLKVLEIIEPIILMAPVWALIRTVKIFLLIYSTRHDKQWIFVIGNYTSQNLTSSHWRLSWFGFPIIQRAAAELNANNFLILGQARNWVYYPAAHIPGCTFTCVSSLAHDVSDCVQCPLSNYPLHQGPNLCGGLRKKDHRMHLGLFLQSCINVLAAYRLTSEIVSVTVNANAFCTKSKSWNQAMSMWNIHIHPVKT